jgi:hypothetical protein
VYVCAVIVWWTKVVYAVVAVVAIDLLEKAKRQALAADGLLDVVSTRRDLRASSV